MVAKITHHCSNLPCHWAASIPMVLSVTSQFGHMSEQSAGDRLTARAQAVPYMRLGKRVRAMRCMACGAEMRLMQVVPEKP